MRMLMVRTMKEEVTVTMMMKMKKEVPVMVMRKMKRLERETFSGSAASSQLMLPPLYREPMKCNEKL